MCFQGRWTLVESSKVQTDKCVWSEDCAVGISQEKTIKNMTIKK